MAILVEGKWNRRDCPEDRVVALVRTLGVSPWIARILVGRGIHTPAEARTFLRPESQPYHDPFPLPDLDPFLQRIEGAIKGRERIVVHGDYDADGITSSAILSFALRRVGLDPVVFLPNRFEGGYGIQPDWVEWAKAEGFNLILACDCGSGAVEAAAKARHLKIDLIVADHHTPHPDLEGPVAHINPHLPGSKYPFKDLCAAGLALKLAQALTALVPPSFQAQYRADLPVDLAMVGTLADVMPLVDENRRIVVDGLDRVRFSPSPGLLALLESARCDPAGVNCETIAFQVAPRLNAAGRLGSPRLAFDLLTETDPTRTREFAVELERINEERKKLGKKAADEVLQRIAAESPHCAVVLADESWHRGVLGIVAAKVTEATGLPSFIASIEDGVAHGSARVPGGYNAVHLLEAASEFTERGGGHAGAAGFTVPMDRWEPFARAIRESAAGMEGLVSGTDLDIDAFFTTEPDWNSLFGEVAQLDPYGEGFPLPAFVLCRFESRNRHQVFANSHLKIQLGTPAEPIEAVGFGMADWARDLEKKPVDIALEYGENHWNGRTTLRPRIVAIRPSLKESSESPHREEVEILDSSRQHRRVVVWDARGKDALNGSACLRVGYGPDWRAWWLQKVPGVVSAWKQRLWEKYSALPAGEWPGNCSVGFGGEVPEEWDGEVLELLWPPLRKSDSEWLADLLAREGEGELLLRLAYDPREIRTWVDLSKADTGRETLACLYRSVTEPTSLSDLLRGSLPMGSVAVALEILLELGLLECEGDRVKRVPNPTRQKAEQAAFNQTWADFHAPLQTWADRYTGVGAGDLVRGWLKARP